MGWLITKTLVDPVFDVDHRNRMRFVRTIFAMLVALGLTLSPVSAALARAHMVKCDHGQMIKDAQTTTTEQMNSAEPDDCPCCKGAANCPPSSCEANCASVQAVLADSKDLPRPLPTALSITPLVMLHWPTSPPDPPPPRV